MPGNLNLNLTSTISTAPATKPQAFYDKALLTVLRQTEFGFDRYAQKKQIPQGNGRVVNFRKLGKLAPALTPLTEGVTPDGATASKTNITATVEQYGDYMSFSDRVNFEEIDPVISGYTVEQGHQARETLDIIVREILSAGTNVFYANSKTARSGLITGDKFSLMDVRKIVRFFKKNHIKPVAGTDYICYISPDTKFDLMDDPEFRKAMEFGNNAKPLQDNEVARMFGVRFIEVVNAKVFPAAGGGTPAADVQAAIVIGRNAFGTTEISGQGNVKNITKGLGSAGTNDPLDQRQTIGWKVNAFGAVRLEELAIARIEHVATK